MERARLLQILREYKERHQKEYGIRMLGVFGSVARDNAAAESDVDIVVSLEKQDLFHLIGIKQGLEEQLQLPVDVISYRNSMNGILKKKIDLEAIYV